MQFLEAQNSEVNTRKPYPQHWADFAIGRWEFWLGNSIVISENRTDIYLGMHGPDAKRHFKQLLLDKDDIESELKTVLDWQELPHRKSSYIYLSTHDFDSEQRDQWAKTACVDVSLARGFLQLLSPTHTGDARVKVEVEQQAVEGHQPDGFTPLKQLQLDFWASFNQYLEANSSLIKGRKPRANSWTFYAIGRWEFGLGSSIHLGKKRIGVDLGIFGPDAKRHFHLLLDQKQEIEQELGVSINRDELPDKKSSYITLNTTNSNPADRNTWPKQHAWMQRWLEAFYNCFHPRTEAMRDL